MYTHPSYRDRLPTTGIIPAPLKLAAIPWPDAAYNPRSPGKSNTHIMTFGCKWGILQKGCQHINHWILNDIKVSQLQTKPHQTIIFVDPLYWQNMDFFPSSHKPSFSGWQIVCLSDLAQFFCCRSNSNYQATPASVRIKPILKPKVMTTTITINIFKVVKWFGDSTSRVFTSTPALFFVKPVSRIGLRTWLPGR